MRATILLAMMAASAAGAGHAQTAATVITPSPYVKAPWWMREPVIASVGYVRAEVPANRAGFSAEFQAVEKTAPEAIQSAAAKVRALGDALRQFGPERVRVETTFSTRPLYEQYKDKDGNLVDNERPDKIQRYQASARVALEIRDTSVVEKVYAAVLAAGPASTQPVYFNLQPDNETKTEMSRLAVADAARRAKLAVEAAGARLGAVKFIDPTARACQTDVLVTGAPESYGTGGLDAQEVTVTGSRVAQRGVAAAHMPAPPHLRRRPPEA